MAITLVLGSTGTVGAKVARALTQTHRHTVRGATRRADAHPVEGVTPVALDLARPETYAAALDGVERLFVMSPAGHAAAHALLGPFLERALSSATLRRVVTMTAQGVEYDDAIPLRQIELQIEASGKDWAHLRPSWFMENFHTYWGATIRAHDRIMLPADDAKVGFVSADDIAACAAALLDADDGANLGAAWTLTGPDAFDHHEAAGVLSAALGRTIAYTPIDDATFRAGLADAGMPGDYADLLVGLFAAVRMGAAAQLTDHVARLTGRPPKTLAEYAAAYAKALRPDDA